MLSVQNNKQYNDQKSLKDLQNTYHVIYMHTHLIQIKNYHCHLICHTKSENRAKLQLIDILYLISCHKYSMPCFVELFKIT